MMKLKVVPKICAMIRFCLNIMRKFNRFRLDHGPVHSNLLRYDVPNKQGRAGL
jgi:hypothetical protein